MIKMQLKYLSKSKSKIDIFNLTKKYSGKSIKNKPSQKEMVLEIVLPFFNWLPFEKRSNEKKRGERMKLRLSTVVNFKATK